MAATDESYESPLLETLSFESPPRIGKKDGRQKQTPCFFCSQCFTVDDKDGRDEFLKHLVIEHKFVIADVKLIANFEKYVEYWREKFASGPVNDYCSVIRTNSLRTDIAPSEDYSLLCDTLPEDKELRIQLQREKLAEVLEQQQQEREDTSFSHGCLFCREQFEGSIATFFNHLAKEHAFNMGLPENLVYKKELIAMLDGQLNKFQCLYCEKFFKDRHVLKEHMRKKNHKRINAQNKTYDRFYVVNYLELGKNWEALQSEDDADIDSDGEATKSANDSWDDWQEEEGGASEQAAATCLFCSHQAPTTTSLMTHMKDSHKFDLMKIKHDLGLSFYHQVKLVNYIRRQVVQFQCLNCQQKFEDQECLLSHMTNTTHINQIPELATWNQPQYFFPTYENDNLLCCLEDSSDDEESSSANSPAPNADSAENPVLPEDILPPVDSVLHNRTVLKELMT